MTTLTFTDRLTVVECYKCGITFALPDQFDAKRREDHQSWYCPNGHGQIYSGESEAEKLRKELAREKKRLGNLEEENRVAWAAAKVDADAAKAERKAHGITKTQLTKTRKRAEKGVCLHCHRHFADMQRHVATVHPQEVLA